MTCDTSLVLCAGVTVHMRDAAVGSVTEQMRLTIMVSYDFHVKARTHHFHHTGKLKYKCSSKLN